MSQNRTRCLTSVSACARALTPSAAGVVVTAGLRGALDGSAVLGLLDHADHRSVAARVLTDGAFGLFGHIAADVAEPHPLLDVSERLREGADVLFIGLQDVEGESLRRLRPDAGKLAELFDKVLEGSFIDSAHTSLSS